MKSNTALITLLHWLVVIAIPFFLGFTTIRLIVSEWYPRYEYAKDNFPADPFGFTQEQRLELALVAVDYLGRPAAAEEVIHLLEEQQIPGTADPLYNSEEISHMVDVKHVTDAIRGVSWIATVIVLGGLAVLLARPETRPMGYRALYYGGVATTVILLALALFILLGWSIFFVQFHELLFPPGTWTFAYTDSLIRLFPEKFWFDLGVILSVGTLLEGIIVGVIGYWLFKGSVGKA
jgi:integral membrane protein (TIGR01906 family)